MFNQLRNCQLLQKHSAPRSQCLTAVSVSPSCIPTVLMVAVQRVCAAFLNKSYLKISRHNQHNFMNMCIKRRHVSTQIDLSPSHNNKGNVYIWELKSLSSIPPLSNQDTLKIYVKMQEAQTVQKSLKMLKIIFFYKTV